MLEVPLVRVRQQPDLVPLLELADEPERGGDGSEDPREGLEKILPGNRQVSPSCRLAEKILRGDPAGFVPGRQVGCVDRHLQIVETPVGMANQVPEEDVVIERADHVAEIENDGLDHESLRVTYTSRGFPPSEGPPIPSPSLSPLLRAARLKPICGRPGASRSAAGAGGAARRRGRPAPPPPRRRRTSRPSTGRAPLRAPGS